ncbi:hypothetical protein L249_4502 [Ophiocordyceps polyrhachis-furcata BCC 54312]|uniref:Uncharacterized protein n=1 Tax=Ophiocordyceps polyrhachis-furcata BCC 54312 TaxID=1330021 RepID=A0A367KZ10_9HYPO|nr:hypothetical protein L249_4502 [Ophiocordyceps polyrhachis-furcata BCC 54312]
MDKNRYVLAIKTTTGNKIRKIRYSLDDIPDQKYDENLLSLREDILVDEVVTLLNSILSSSFSGYGSSGNVIYDYD